MEKWNLIVDVERCENCNNCVLSAKDEYVGNEHPGYSAPVAAESAELITITRKVRGTTPVVDAAYLVSMCAHCDNAPCLKSGGDAIRKRDDGIMIIDPVKAKGRRDIAESCPYNAIVWNEELQLPQIWIFDAHLLDQGWTKPRCVQSCPTDVFEAVKISDADMQRRVEAEQLEVLKPELDTRPRVYYRNLYRFNRCFIGGTVVAEVDGVEDCLADARVTLTRNGEVLQSTHTDAFGEFKLDRLEADSGAYSVCIEHDGFAALELETEVADSVYLGVHTLRAVAH
ncbi:MAG: 4Fe-4S dicluster domain-containing protein [Pseudomonadota bacterium]